MGGFTTQLTVLDLAAIIQTSDATSQVLPRQAELMAGRRVDAHGGVVNLTVDEWKDRWEEYRRSVSPAAARTPNPWNSRSRPSRFGASPALQCVGSRPIRARKHLELHATSKGDD